MRGSDIKTRYGAILLDHHHRLNGIDDLPDVVLMEILCRLPSYKFVSHCKCVSKRWCSLISDPYFISRCASLQREYNHQETPIILINQTRELLNRMSDPLKPFFERLVKFYGLIQEPEVAGAYNDLLLCYAGEYHERNYYICNPFTQQWIALPPTPPCHEKTFSIPEGFMCALPYYNNNITDAAKDNNPNNIAQLNTNYRCKVVRLISPRHGIESSKFKVQIFSSETGEWKESIVSSPQDIFLFSLKSNICFVNAYNRMLYWMGDNAFLVELDPFELDGHGDDHHY
ncbi:hypothetical protein Pyn_33286 [Prunus yedoensis var. nudiflora]|uniref:F-box domain-containing protein n=1 Tax=Prunus yedoensis var. nudiflora TaxID=2094558 RepID=A0A314ZJK6_PRUYE|nr:hypothetical protein Pyn_33286 [Prunus yedoensis var. nudiflora]